MKINGIIREIGDLKGNSRQELTRFTHNGFAGKLKIFIIHDQLISRSGAKHADAACSCFPQISDTNKKIKL